MKTLNIYSKTDRGFKGEHIGTFCGTAKECLECARLKFPNAIWEWDNDE